MVTYDFNCGICQTCDDEPARHYGTLIDDKCLGCGGNIYAYVATPFRDIPYHVWRAVRRPFADLLDVIAIYSAIWGLRRIWGECKADMNDEPNVYRGGGDFCICCESAKMIRELRECLED